MIQGFKQAALDAGMSESSVLPSRQNAGAAAGFGQLLSEHDARGVLIHSLSAPRVMNGAAQDELAASTHRPSALEMTSGFTQLAGFPAELSAESSAEPSAAASLPSSEITSAAGLAPWVGGQLGGQLLATSDEGAELSTAQHRQTLFPALSSAQVKLPLSELIVQDAINKVSANSHELGQYSDVNRATASLEFKAVLDKQISAKQMGQQLSALMADKISLQVNAKTPTATIRLDPPELGKIDLVVKLDNDKLHVQISASSHATRESIQLTSERLRAELVEQNFLHVEVAITSDSQSTPNQSAQFSAADDDSRVFAASADRDPTQDRQTEQALARA